MTHASLFSGIAGFDLAAEWMGWTNLFNCEWEEFPRQVLKHHFPNAIQHGDIKELDATAYAGRVDILTGGFPCQPYSTAGKRLGKEDERHLWPEMLRVIRECSPRWIVGENVRGLVNWNGGLVFEEVCADLETCGYSVQPFVLPAAGVGAPHRRDRVWFVAYGKDIGFSQTKDARRERGKREPNDRHEVRHTLDANGRVGNAPDTKDIGRGGRSCQQRQERRQGMVSGERQGREVGSEATGRSRTWDDFPTVPPVCGGDDGLPKELDGITFSKWRRESIKAYGNAIVPQVALQIFKAIQAHEDGKTI